MQQYQVVVDPQKLQAYGITLAQVTEAIRASNRDVGGRVVEMSETEYVVRGRGYLRSTDDLEQIVLKADSGGTPVLLRDVARIELGPESAAASPSSTARARWSAASSLQRDGAERAARDRQRQAEASPNRRLRCPKASRSAAVYDRSDLIHRAIETLQAHADRGKHDRRRWSASSFCCMSAARWSPS